MLLLEMLTNSKSKDNHLSVREISSGKHHDLFAFSSNMHKFVDLILQKDPEKRPTSKEILLHPLLRDEINRYETSDEF